MKVPLHKYLKCLAAAAAWLIIPVPAKQHISSYLIIHNKNNNKIANYLQTGYCDAAAGSIARALLCLLNRGVCDASFHQQTNN